MSKLKLAFPQMGNYKIPAKFLFSHILDVHVMDAKPITKNTIELGNKHSPEFVCTPFKYTLGTLIECLDEGAHVLVQMGGGCRYGYYSELQDQILNDLGYNFIFINLITAGRINIKDIYKSLKKVDKRFNLVKGIYYLYITAKMVKYMDQIDDYIRHNIGFEVNKGEFEKLNKRMLEEFNKVKSISDLKKKYRYYNNLIRNVKINKPNKVYKVGIIGELYTIMEPFANYFLERELANYNIEITRYTNVKYLLFEKRKKLKKYIKNTKYINYSMGADASDNIARTVEMCKEQFDGIIHIKASFCTPEIAAMPIISKITSEYNIPIIFFSFDSNTSEIGIKTRLEAFRDMLEMRNNK